MLRLIVNIASTSSWLSVIVRSFRRGCDRTMTSGGSIQWRMFVHAEDRRTCLLLCAPIIRRADGERDTLDLPAVTWPTRDVVFHNESDPVSHKPCSKVQVVQTRLAENESPSCLRVNPLFFISFNVIHLRDCSWNMIPRPCDLPSNHSSTNVRRRV